MADDYNQLIENLFDSIDTIAAARVKDLEFNKTVRCEIADTTKRNKGEYTVTDGSTKFKAYSDNIHFERGDYVNVIIPNGDYSAQKMIVGRCLTEDEDTFNYISPMKSYIDITQNLIEDEVVSAGLVANGQKSCVTLWEKKDFGGMKAYQRLGLRADFKSWLSALNPIEGNYGLRLSIIGRSMNTTQTESQLKYFTFTLDSDDMYGDPYKFDSFFSQEKVFDIEEIPQIESIKLEFYQEKNFKNKQGKYIAHEDSTGYSLGQNLFIKAPYISLGYSTDKFTSDTVLLYSLEEDTYANYLTDKVKEEEMQKVEEINTKLTELEEKKAQLERIYQQALVDLEQTYGDKNSSEYKNGLYKIESEYQEKKALYQHQYEMLKNDLNLNDPDNLQQLNDEKNTKNIFLRWIHKDEEQDRMVGIQNQDEMPDGAKIHWYRYVLREGLTDPIAGPFWEEIDTSNWESPFLYEGFVPNDKQEKEQLRAVVEYKSKDYVNFQLIPNDPDIIELDNEINKGTATDEQKAERESLANAYLEEVKYYFSEILTFTNEAEVANETSVSLIKDLKIVCDEKGGKGIYNLYDSTGNLLSQIEGTKKRILTATYNTMVTGESTIDLPETVTWRIPLTNTMIYPPTEGVEYSTYSKVSITSADKLVIGTHYIYDNNAADKYRLVAESDVFDSNADYYIKNLVETKIADDGSYIDITRYGAVSSRIAGTEEADSMDQYFRIKSQYSQNLTNNTVYCIVKKNNKTFEASYTMHFGTTGTNGTNYTFVLEVDNAVPAMTWNTREGITVSPKILDYTGKDITSNFAASNFTYSWYSPTTSGDRNLTIDKLSAEEDQRKRKIGFKSDISSITATYHHILQCKATVDISYKTNQVNSSQTEDKTTVQTTETKKPVTLVAYLPIAIRRTDKYTGFEGANQICYSNSGTNPEYYRNEYKLYCYDKEQKITKLLPTYEKVTTNKQADFDKGIYYEQSFEFTEVSIGSQAELQPGVHYKSQDSFIKVKDSDDFNTKNDYYAKTADNRYVEVEIDSNDELHKGQYYIRKDEFVIATDNDIFDNIDTTDYFYTKDSNGEYNTLNPILDVVGGYNFIKGRYYSLDGEEYVLIGPDEIYDANTKYYTNKYIYTQVTNPTEEEFNQGKYYSSEFDYIKISGENTSYDSKKTYYILATDQEYYPIKTLNATNYKNGVYYYLQDNGKYALLQNVHYFDKNNEYYIKGDDGGYYQVDIQEAADLTKIQYYNISLGYRRVEETDNYNPSNNYYVLASDGEWEKATGIGQLLHNEYEWYSYEKERYNLVSIYADYDSSEQYYTKINDVYYASAFEDEADYREQLISNGLYTKEIYKELISNYDNHEYNIDNLYFVRTGINSYIQVEITEKESLKLNPYFIYEVNAYEANAYNADEDYYLKILQNGTEEYLKIIITSQEQLSKYTYFYKDESNNYIKVEDLFDNSQQYYVQYENNKYIGISLESNENLKYGIYYIFDNVYQYEDPAYTSYNTYETYYTRSLIGNWNQYLLSISSQSDLDEVIQKNEYCFKLQTKYTRMKNKNEYNNQNRYFRQTRDKQFIEVTINNINDILVIDEFYILKKSYRAITDQDFYKNSAHYYTYDDETGVYTEVKINSNAELTVGVHYILEDGYYAILPSDTFDATKTYYVKDINGQYYKVIVSSTNELQTGTYYFIDNEKVLVTTDDVYNPDVQYFLPGNIVYSKPKAYDANKTYYVCTARWKIKLGSATGYDSSKSATNKNNAKVAKCYPIMSQDNTLVPLSLFIQETKPDFSAICVNETNNNVLWVQPIRIFLNAHSSQLLNAWNGSLTIDEENGTILSSLVGAGKKDSENRFYGILMGDMEKASIDEPANEYYTGTGLYGFNAGIKSFGLNINGRAFFGKPGRGQILIDGNSGKIKSARYAATESQSTWRNREGMLINMDTGLIRCHGIDSKATISIDPNNTKDGDNELGYFRINSATGNSLMHVGDSAYYLKTDDYQARESSTANGKTTIKKPGKGLKFNLKDGRLTGYSFAITAYANEKAGTYNSSDIKYISINSSAETYPLRVGDKFKVNWNGKITSTGGTIGGWEIGAKTLYNKHGDYTVTLAKAEANTTKVIRVYQKSKNRYNFYVQANGYMFARDAKVKGEIEASKGKIGGWNISSDRISAGGTTLYKSGKIKCNNLTTSGTVYIGGSSIHLAGTKVSIEKSSVITNIDGVNVTVTRNLKGIKVSVSVSYRWRNITVIGATGKKSEKKKGDASHDSLWK